MGDPSSPLVQVQSTVRRDSRTFGFLALVFRTPERGATEDLVAEDFIFSLPSPLWESTSISSDCSLPRLLDTGFTEGDSETLGKRPDLVLERVLILTERRETEVVDQE